LTTKSYPFIQLLNVVMFSVAGVLGLIFLRQTLHRLTSLGNAASPGRSDSELGADPQAEDGISDAPSALDMPAGQALGRHTRAVFGCWMVVFALVGAQMGWVLRPFIGNPNSPFTWFRERKSNFFEAVLNAIEALFTGA
jgi:hypothetical protein